MLSSKESYDNKGGLKYFIGYISNFGIIPLYIKIPQMNAFVKNFDSNNMNSKCMNLLVRDIEILKNTMQYELKLIIYLKNNLIVSQCIMINT